MNNFIVFQSFNVNLEKLLTRQLIDVFEQCVKFGESNSALVIGPRGSGKTKVILTTV